MSILRRLSPSLTAGTLAVWLAGGGVGHAQGSTHRQVWRGTEILEDAFNFGGRIRPAIGTPAQYYHLITVNFTYTEEIDPQGRSRFVSKRISWDAAGTSVAPGYETVTCQGSGGGELVGASGAQVDAILRIPCSTQKEGNFFGFFTRPPDHIKPPDLVSLDKLRDNCSYSEETAGRRYSVWLTPNITAVMDVDTHRGSAYASFVPSPGRNLELKVRTDPPFPARFRFVIDHDRTSHFAGYAGNALIDDAFFKRYQLERLAHDYNDNSPDLIFNPANFDERVWSVRRQDEVETASNSGGAAAMVTAMDYGAIGKIRAFVKYKCGGWTPVQINVGNARADVVSVPMDEDGNLIADLLEPEKGSADRDDDRQPAGDGTKGDGLTAFEEYRGFMTAGTDCDDPQTDVHKRTNPWEKDVFVAAGEDSLRHLSRYFARATYLNVVELCERHLWDLDSVKTALEGFDAKREEFLSVSPESRVVNFTLARARQTTFDDHPIHTGPQHGLYLKFDGLVPHLAGNYGLAIPTESGAMGSPKNTAAVMFSLGFSLTSWIRSEHPELGDPREPLLQLMGIIAHELGHSVGVPHHSDSRQGSKVIVGKLDVTPSLSRLEATAAGVPSVPEGYADALLIEPGAGCQEGDPEPAYRDGKFAGCLATVIVRRGQQESGNVQCPMRYWITDYYEPPGVTAQYLWSGTVTNSKVPGPDTASFVADAWGGGVLRWKIDVPPIIQRWGRFCRATAGNEENARPDYWNLAGNAGRSDPCDHLIVVNDHPTK